ncbi:MAG: ECF transporter S component [Ruminococcaceae bacterium]|nr:ECF transporter S component [Oscillospiraceae bacterium]
MRTNKRTEMIVGTAILAAVLIVLQTLVSAIKIGPFAITLSIIPIILGAVMYGPKSSTILGAVFGVVVTASVISGTDVGGAMMYQKDPIMTVVLCMLKAMVAGFVAGVIANTLANKGKTKLGVILASIAAPVCNTGLFVLGGYLFFLDIFKSWAEGKDLVLYIITGLIGFNFLIEMAVGLVMVPVIVFVIKSIRKGR